MSKIIFIKHLPHEAQISPKIETVQNLLKFGIFDISNIPILILMSKMIFMKYLPAIRAKLTPRLKLLRNSYLTFQVFRS